MAAARSRQLHQGQVAGVNFYFIEEMVKREVHRYYSIVWPMHYWLKWSIGFLNVKKKSKSKRFFLTQGTPKTDNFAFFVKSMTQILSKIIFSLCWQSENGQNSDKCRDKFEGGLRRGWFLAWWKYRPCWEKKLKISSSSEAPFMVKLDF